MAEKKFDLSFVDTSPETTPKEKAPKQEGGKFDTSFAVVDKTGEIKPGRQEKQEDRPWYTGVTDFFTGNDRETEQTKEMPEFDLPFEFSARQAKTALGLLTSFDPEDQAKVLKSNYPDLKFSEDAKGNIIVDGSTYGGGKGVMNMPGVSARDLLQAGFQVALFTPAGRLGQAAATTKGGMALTGGASAVTQAGQDLVSQASGRTEEVSLSNIDKTEVGLAGAFGGAFEGIGRVISKFRPRYMKAQRVTPEMREQFKAAAAKVGRNPDEVTDDLIESWMRSADEATNLQGARNLDEQALQQTDEFGIRYTRGQALAPSDRKVSQMSLEDTLQNTSASPKARQTMDDFRTLQTDDIARASDNLQSKFGGGRSTIDRPNEAAGNVADTIQAKAAQLDEAVGQAYDEVGDAFLSADGVKGLAQSLRKFARQEGFETASDLAPSTAKALERTDNLIKALSKMEGRKIKPFHIEKIESMRRRINNLIGTAANPTDKRQMTLLKQQFDRGVNDAVDQALFSGDETAIEALKKARGLSAEYFRQFTRRDARTRTGRPLKDSAGDLIERIVADDPTNEQVANYLFGASKLGGKNTSAKLAARVKDLVGEDSEAWQGVRQAAFLKLAEPSKGSGVVSGKVFMNRLNEAVSGSGESFMKQVFTPDEISTLRRFGNAVLRAQPERANPSGTAYKAADIVSQTSENLLRMLGYSQGPVTGVMTEGGLQAKGLIRNIRDTSKALRATQAFRPKGRNMNAPGIGAGAQMQGRLTEERQGEMDN